MKSCVFCSIVKGDAPAYKVYEDKFSMAILDINPFSEGHCLIISKRHVCWWYELTEEETHSLFNVARLVANKLKCAFNPDFVCMYARGKRIPHVHIFLVPTFENDPLDRFFNALEKFQESSQSLAELKTQKSLEEAVSLLIKK